MKKGFTLIELLVVIGILATLLTIVLVAMNPGRQFGSARNTKRKNDVLQLLNSVGYYVVGNSGRLPAQITSIPILTPVIINATTMPNLCPTLVPLYIPALPTDPSFNTSEINGVGCSSPSNWNTGYTIMRDANNRLTVAAATTDNGVSISVVR